LRSPRSFSPGSRSGLSQDDLRRGLSGADKGHGCQFSFACDGREPPRSGTAWVEAKQIASRAIGGEADVKIISTATHYHADYVQPRWAGTMKRLIKIGRHVFYRES
jgi:spore germination cell wall hydrolase CwlJ-like protein